MYLICAGQLRRISIKCQQSFPKTPLWSSELILWAVSTQFKPLVLFPDLDEQKRLFVTCPRTSHPNFCLCYCYISFYLIQSWSIIRAILVLNADNALTKRILSALSRSCLEVAESRSYLIIVPYSLNLRNLPHKTFNITSLNKLELLYNI